MRNLALTFESGDDLDVRSFTVLEAMSSCFQIDLVVRGREDLDLRAVARRHPAASPSTGRPGEGRACARIAQTQGRLSTYALQRCRRCGCSRTG